MATATPFRFDFPSQIFIDFLNGDEAAVGPVYRTFARKLPWWTRRWARELPDDLVEEVAQETWLMLKRSGQTGFEAAGQPVVRYVIGVLLNALKVVRSSYRQPGTPSRRSRGSRRPTSTITLEKAEAVGSEALLSNEECRLNARIDLVLMAARSGPTVARALAVMLERGITIKEAATEMGVSRQTLSRHLHGLSPAA